MTEKEYRKHPGINQSTLGKLAGGPKGVKQKEDEGDKSYFTLGSLVDCKLTDPDSFNEKYYMMVGDKPSDAMVAYAVNYLKTDDHLLAWAASGLKGDPTIVAKSSKDGKSKWDKEGKPYYDQLKKASEGLRDVFEVIDLYTINNNENFKMQPGFRSFQKIEKEIVLATSNLMPIQSNYAGRLFMPLYQREGSEGFFIIKKIRPIYSKASLMIRNLKLDNLLSLLPGVNWRTTIKKP